MATRITIEVDGTTAVETHAPAAAATAPTPGTAAGGYDAGSAPGADASHAGPVPFVGAAGTVSAALNPAFNPEGAISAGPAPEHLMGGMQ